MAELNKDQKKQLELQAEEGRKLKALTEQPGWTDIIGPALIAMRKQLLVEIVGYELGKELVRAQERIKIINWLLNFVKTGIEMGKASQKQIEDAEKEKD